MGGTELMRRYALSRDLLDTVNARSSHTVATPRGGGVAIVAVCLLAVIGGVALFDLPVGNAIGIGGAGALVAAVGWRDDHAHVPAVIRLACHVAAAAWLTAWIGIPELPFLPATSATVAILLGCAVFGIAWLINLFNFMDGIDGLAASEAVFVFAGGALLLATASGALSATAILFALFAAACAGFLWWNWPPARIFMGDASSGFLGLMIGALVLIGAAQSWPLGVAMVLLPALFVTDATVTLLRRMVRRDAVFDAHRSHAYQRLSRRLGAHLPVTLGALAVNVAFVLPVSYAVAAGLLDPLVGIVAAYLPLAIACLLLGAGREE